MKKIFCILSFVLFATVVFSQGNLQFNQVINLVYSTPAGQGYSGLNNATYTVTVPAGKVWKIESASLSYKSATGVKYYIADATNEITQLVLDGAIIAVESDDFYKNTCPIWLTEGAHTFILQGYINSSTQYQWNALITGIEFNVIP